jgi:AbrB family looped-hinge helix DNA binding protein
MLTSSVGFDRRPTSPFDSDLGCDAPPPCGRLSRPCGTIHGMTITMDGAGRIVIPSEIRREAGLQPDTPLEVRWRDGVIEIEPRPLPVTLERRGRLVVARPRVKVEPLRAALVERARRRIGER